MLPEKKGRNTQPLAVTGDGMLWVSVTPLVFSPALFSKTKKCEARLDFSEDELLKNLVKMKKEN